MVLMLANSVLWGLVLTTLVVLARWSFRRKVWSSIDQSCGL